MSNNLSVIKLTNPETKETLTLCPDLGGTITSLRLGNNLFEVLESDEETDLLKNPLFRGRFLFPFNDRIPGGKYSISGKKYQLAINCSEDESAIHGFIFNKEVFILNRTETEAVFCWRTRKDQIQGYPFDISLKTEIKLHNGGVKISFTVKNEGTIPAPYALGWHSYFKTDPSSTLKAEYPSYFETDESFLPLGDSLSVDNTLFDFRTAAGFSNTLLDHTFIVPNDGISILKNNKYSIKIEQNNFAYTQLFLPPNKKSIAIEPISSKPNSFNTNEVRVLKAGEEYNAGIGIDLQQIVN
jgi:aldose 1-epimerase